MNIKQFASLLFEIEFVAHVAHLQTTSYAQHMALGDLYEGIADLRDKFIEDYQGKYGIIKGYSSVSSMDGIDMIKYLEDRSKSMAEFRLTLTDGFLQQDIDDQLSLISSTLYKLRNLK